MYLCLNPVSVISFLVLYYLRDLTIDFPVEISDIVSCVLSGHVSSSARSNPKVFGLRVIRVSSLILSL